MESKKFDRSRVFTDVCRFLETRGDEQARDSIMIPAEDDHDVLCRRPGVIALPEVFTFHRPLIQLQWVQGG